MTTFHKKVVVLRDVFAKSIKKPLVFEGHFSKCKCFFIGGTPRNQSGTSAARNEYLIIWKSEPYYARRIFREISVFEAWDSNNQFRLEISSNLPQKLPQTVEYCLKNEPQTFEKHGFQKFVKN